MMANERIPTLDDVLNEFVAEHEQPTADALEVWVGRYPQFRRELIDFAAAWAEQIVLAPASELSSEVEKRIADRAMSHALNVSFSRDEQAESRQSNEDTIKSLTGEAKDAGMNPQEFAKSCGLDLSLIAKLNNRQVRPDTIPPRLFRQIARVLNRPIEAVRDYLGEPPSLAGRAFLAREKPQNTEQQSFADAVRVSSLSAAEKARWLDELSGGEDR